MSLITLGINHKSASLNLRERLAFTPQSLPEALNGLIAVKYVKEAVILSTCNRTELYCAVDKDDDSHLIEWFQSFHGLDQKDLEGHLYTHNHEQTIHHALQVACGLDSMVLGEPQITGQMKQAYSVASSHGTVGKMLSRLFEHAFSVAKKVRTDTEIGSSPVSIAFAAISLARQIFGELDQSCVLLVGAGDTIELAARHLKSQNIREMIIANRSVERAQILANEFNGTAIGLQHIGDHLHKADVVISSTASPVPILGKGTVERALIKRKHGVMFMVDLAVPRDIEPEVGELDDVYLYTVDDLQSVIDENLQSRIGEAEKAQEIINDNVDNFLSWQHSLGSVDVITEFREYTKNISDEVLEKARSQIAAGHDAESVLEYLANTLTNKFLHLPSTRLREASQDNDHNLIKVARKLLFDKD